MVAEGVEDYGCMYYDTQSTSLLRYSIGMKAASMVATN